MVGWLRPNFSFLGAIGPAASYLNQLSLFLQVSYMSETIAASFSKSSIVAPSCSSGSGGHGSLIEAGIRGSTNLVDAAHPVRRSNALTTIPVNAAIFSKLRGNGPAFFPNFRISFFHF